ncbi:hypothetical protein M413DRAFT_267745 [Hebeloma cylindrosporum]|uniref:Uncharacterized protein n=1 Tax=Hebeloma cylindrosporum TaxID=76867 RepID=A0A0C3CSY0_HEBCY|nr:hypothetical protein M413DRAFT_267745 [Hebeloma cylindrosporum h7]
MDYTRDGGYYYPKGDGPDNKDEDDSEMVHDSKKAVAGRNLIPTRSLSPTKAAKGKTSSLLNGLMISNNASGREPSILHQINGHSKSRMSREEVMNDLERGNNSPVGSTHSALLDHVEEARNGYAVAAAAAEAAGGGKERKRSRSWSRTWTGGRSRTTTTTLSKEKNELPPMGMSHTKSSSSSATTTSRPVTPNRAWKKFSISGGLSGTHAGFAPKRPEEEKSGDPPTKAVSDIKTSPSSPPSASIRSRPPSRPLPPPPAAVHAGGGEGSMTNTSMTSVHDRLKSASTNADSNTEATHPMTTTRRVDSNLPTIPPPLPPKLAISTSEGGATKPRVLPPPNHRFSLTLYGSSTGYNPRSSAFSI